MSASSPHTTWSDWGGLTNSVSLLLSSIDGALVEMAHLRNLEPPSPEHIRRLRRELDKLTAESLLAQEVTVCWAPDNDDDLAVLRSGVDSGGRISTWIRFGAQMLKWELWGRQKARSFDCSCSLLISC